MNIPFHPSKLPKPTSTHTHTHTHKYHRRNPRNIAKFSNSPPLFTFSDSTPFDSSASGCWIGVYGFVFSKDTSRGCGTWKPHDALFPCTRIRTRDGSVDRGRKRCIHPSIHPSPIVSPPTPRWLATPVCRALFESFKVTRWRISFQVCAV